MESRPQRTPKGPFGFVAIFESAVGMTDFEYDRRAFFPSIILALKIVVKELFLQGLPFVLVKRVAMVTAVHLQPFILGGGSIESLEIPPRMEAHSSPVGPGKKRDRDFGKIRTSPPIQWAIEDLI